MFRTFFMAARTSGTRSGVTGALEVRTASGDLAAGEAGGGGDAGDLEPAAPRRVDSRKDMAALEGAEDAKDASREPSPDLRVSWPSCQRPGPRGLILDSIESLLFWDPLIREN